MISYVPVIQSNPNPIRIQSEYENEYDCECEHVGYKTEGSIHLARVPCSEDTGTVLSVNMAKSPGPFARRNQGVLSHPLWGFPAIT